MTEVRLYNGETIELSGQSVQEYIAWRKRFLNVVGQVLAVKFPELYGKIEFNFQGGKFVNANHGDSIKGYPIPESELDLLVDYFDQLAAK